MDSPVASGKCVESGMSFFAPPSTVGWLFANGGVRGRPASAVDRSRRETPVRDRACP